MNAALSSLAITTLRIITFRATKEELQSLNYRHFIFGLCFTWLAGFGRTWDDPTVEPLRRTGLGSIAYVFVLALILWSVLRPLTLPQVSYFRILTFVVLTSPPALLYAVPIEQVVPASTALVINKLFLLFVATWRVALLVFFIRRGLELGKWQTAVATLFPLSFIMSILTFFAVQYHVAQAMGGLRKGGEKADETLFAITMYLGMISMAAFLPLWGFHSKFANDLKYQEIAERNRKALDLGE